MRTTVSVVLTTYNGERFLLEQLDSIRDQSHTPDEVIILDDCSNDNTAHMVRQYIDANRLTNWRLVVNETNRGWKRNFTNGFDLAQSDLILPADQDDIWYLDKVERMTQVMDEHPEIQVLVSNYHMFVTGSDGRLGAYRFPMENDGSLQQLPIWERWYYTTRPGCTYAFRKAFYNRVRGKWNDAYPHDGNLWQLACMYGGLYLLNETLIEFRRHGDNATSDFHFTRQFRIEDNDRAIWANHEAMQICTNEEDREILERIMRFLRLRDDVLRRRRMWRWPVLLVRYNKYYNTNLGVFADLVYAFERLPESAPHH